MDGSRFVDQLARALVSGASRRRLLQRLSALPLAGGLALLLADDEESAAKRRAKRHAGDENHKRKGHRRKHGKHHHKHKKHKCTPESPAQTCAGKCGTVQNNCQQSAACGSCACDPPCDACFRCNETTRACEPDSTQRGEACGESGQTCQADGICACDANSCGACDTCQANGRCAAHCGGTGCCDGTTCVAGTTNGACGQRGERCVRCTGSTTCSNGVCTGGGGGCTPTTCSAQGANCGAIPDGCGETLDCGTCTAPQTCGGGGTPNVCGGGGCTSSAECQASGLGDLCCGDACFIGICCGPADCVPFGNNCDDHQCTCGNGPACSGETPDCCDAPTSVCTNTETDEDNCGACGNTCMGDTPVCWDGVCVCGDVCPSGCQFSAVAEAVEAALLGSTISICAGDFVTSVNVFKALTLRGAGADQTILRGPGALRVMEVRDVVLVQNLTITGGNQDIGGGILNRGTLTLGGVVVTGNTANVGGGIENFVAGGSPVLILDNSHVTANMATGRGGGIDKTNGTVTLTNGSTVTNNVPDNCFPPGTIAGCVG
jgi:hypothetical protein